MVNLTFEIDTYFLVSYIIANYKKGRFIPYAEEQYKKDIVAFQNIAWAKSKDLCMVLDGRFPIFKFNLCNNWNFREASNTIDTFIADLSKSEEFRLLLKQVNNSKIEIEKEWKENFRITSAYIQNIGINIEDTYTAYLVHPGLKAGNYIGKNKLIWSNQTYWPNYNTVYLWHEILHSYFESNDYTHSIIEFVTDEEMRKILNGQEYPPFVGHSNLTEIKNKDLAVWEEYLDRGKKDIKNLVKQFKKLG